MLRHSLALRNGHCGQRCYCLGHRTRKGWGTGRSFVLSSVVGRRPPHCHWGSFESVLSLMVGLASRVEVPLWTVRGPLLPYLYSELNQYPCCSCRASSAAQNLPSQSVWHGIHKALVVSDLDIPPRNAVAGPNRLTWLLEKGFSSPTIGRRAKCTGHRGQRYAQRNSSSTWARPRNWECEHNQTLRQQRASGRLICTPEAPRPLL
jgi:hypothetical protein